MGNMVYLFECFSILKILGNLALQLGNRISDITGQLHEPVK